MANTADKVVNYALTQTGYLEKKDNNLDYLYSKKANAGYNNYTMYGYELNKLYPDIIDYPAAWCDCFVDYCFYKTYGITTAKKLLGGFNDYTKESINLYKSKNAFFLKNEKQPLPGDQIFFSKNGFFSGVYHTGLVKKVENNVVYTIEGNTSNGSEVEPNGGAVCEKSYSLTNSKIYGYGRPPYDEPVIIETDISCGKDGLLILADELNIRKNPSVNSDILGTYKYGQKVKVTKKAFNNNNPWFKTDKGWISGKYCEGWILEDNNLWWYVMKDYSYPKNEIKTIDNQDYIFDKNGWLIMSNRISESGAIIY